MSTATTLQDLKVLTAELMKKEGVSKYDLQVQGHSAKGENYLGEVTFFTVLPAEGGISYHLVMKTAKRSEELRKSMPVELAYLRESYMYSRVFPELRKFLEESNSEIELDYVPKIFLTCDEDKRETLILADLKINGYKLWNRKQPMDLNHVLFAMEKIGKHHAIAMAMKSQKPEMFKNLTSSLTNIWNEFSQCVDSNVLYSPLLENALKLLEDAGRGDLVPKFKVIQDNITGILIDETVEEDRIVICHGDFWNNNMLFKYQEGEKTKPAAMSFLDFQMSVIDTPVKDLSYFIYSACDKSTLDKLDLLLQTYHISVCRTLKALGSNPDDLFTYQQLKYHWKKYAKFGLLVSTLLVKIELLSTEEAPDLGDILEDGNDIEGSFNFKIGNEEAYHTRLRDNFIHYGETVL